MNDGFHFIFKTTACHIRLSDQKYRFHYFILPASISKQSNRISIKKDETKKRSAGIVGRT